MRTIPHGKQFKSTLVAVALGLLIGGLAGCFSSGSGGSVPGSSSAPSPTSNPLSGTMLTSTEDSGLTVTVGMPEGDIAKPAGNPVTVTTVPSDEQQTADGYTRVLQDDSSLAYTGSWTSSVMPSTTTAAMESAAAGSQVNYTFTGTAVRWIGYRDPWSGVADVYLDGMHVATVDTYSTVPMTGVVLYSASNLSDARHLLTVEAEGRHDAAALDAAVWVTAFDAKLTASTSASTTGTASAAVTASASTGYTRIEQNDASVSYGGSWSTQSSSLTADFSGGSAAESANAGASATLAFNGTAVRWIGYSDTFSGIADVYLDGAHVATVDTYSLLPASQVVMYSATGLSAGNHTLEIEATGQHPLLALGSQVWVDAFDVIESPIITPPSVSMTAPANGTTVSGTVMVSANATAGSGAQITSVQFKLDGGALGAAATSAPYSISWDSTSVANGSHTLTAVATDSAGNQSTATPVTVTVSNGGGSTSPTVSMTAPANGSTVSGSVAVSASASDSAGIASVQFELDGSALGSPVTSAPYSISWDSTTVGNGSHTLSAVATDDNGNTGTASPITVTVSNTSNTTPTVTMTAPTNGSTVSGTVTVSASASDSAGIASVQFQLDGSPLGGPITSTPYSISWDSTTVGNGSHTLSAVATDRNGNTGTATAVTVTVSNSIPAPTVTMTAPADGSSVSGSITVSASAKASGSASISSVQFELDGSALGSPVTSAPYSVSWDTTAVANGSHSLTAVATDSNGNTGTASPVTVTVSNSSGSSAPTVTMTAPANGSSVSGSVTVSANATASGSATISSVQFELDGTALGAPVTGTPYSVSWDSTTATNGSHSLTAVATDSNGNKGTATSVTVTVSNSSGGSTPPTVNVTAPANGSTVSGSVAVSANAAASGSATISSVQFQLDGAALGSPVTSAPYSISWDTTTASNGSHTLTAVATDSSGKTTTSAGIGVTVSNSNSGGGGTTTRIEQDNPAVSYTGTWITASDPSVSGGTADESNEAGATCTLTFTGTAVTWISYLGPNTAGIASVSVDNGPATQVDTYAASNQAQAKVFTASNLAKGTHTLKITISGTYDRNGNSAYVVVDAFDVTD